MKSPLINLTKSTLFPYILLSAVAFFSYHQLLGMYFWRDDYSTLYAVQQGYLIDQPVYAYPYHLNILMSEYFWRIFGLDTRYYFGAEIILFVLAAWILYYFLQKLFSDKRIAFFCSLVFGAGYLGQDALKMSLEGLLSLTALNLTLMTLLTLLVYLQHGRKLWFFCSLLSFFLTLEIAAHRTSTLVVVLLAFNWFFLGKKRVNDFLINSSAFLLIFVIQYYIHPSALFLNYKIGGSVNFWRFLTAFSSLYLLNPFGTFWNMIVPTDLQELLNRRIGIQDNFILFKFWVASLPAVAISSTLFLYLKLMRPAVASLRKLGLCVFFIIISSFAIAFLIYQQKADRSDLVSIENGIVLFIFLLLWIAAGASKFRRLSLLSIFTLFGLNMLFFFTIPDRVLVSFNRYLLASSFTPALLVIIFVSKEFYLKDRRKSNLAVGLFVGLSLLLVVSRLGYALSTQKEFVTSYSQHARGMYQSLRAFLPDIKGRQVIYIEGSNKNLSLSVGDAARVGFLGSEAAFAVHYRTKKENIILPQTLAEIPQLLAKNSDLSLENVHTFIYDEKGLRETSQETRKMFNAPKELIIVTPDNWQKDTKGEVWQLNPSTRISTFLPLETTIQLKFTPQKTRRIGEFSWSYNTVGLLDQPKSAQLDTITDGRWHEYKFIIPGGGEYLQTIFFTVPDDTSVEIGKTQFSYPGDY